MRQHQTHYPHPGPHLSCLAPAAAQTRLGLLQPWLPGAQCSRERSDLPLPVAWEGSRVVTDKGVKIAPLLLSNADGGSFLQEWRWPLNCMNQFVQWI